MRERLEAEGLGIGAGRRQRVVEHGQRPVRDPWEHRDEDDGHFILGGFANHLVAGDHADIDEDRQHRDHRDDSQKEGAEAEQRDEEHADAGEQGVAGAGADRFPAGMADIDRDREGIAEHCADRRGQAVGQHDLTGRIGIARGMCALDVLKVEHVVGKAERDGRGEVGQGMRQALKEAADMQRRRIEAEGRQRFRHGGGALQPEDPGQRRAGEEQQEAGRHLRQERLLAEPVEEDQHQDDEGDGGRLEGLQHRVHRQKQQAKPGKARQQHGARNELADFFSEERAAGEDRRLDDAPDESDLQGEFGVLGLQIDRQDDEEGYGENRRRTRPRGQCRDIRAAGDLHQPVGEIGVPEAGGENGEAECRCDPAEHHVFRQADDEDQQCDHRQKVGQVVGEEAEITTPVPFSPNEVSIHFTPPP